MTCSAAKQARQPCCKCSLPPLVGRPAAQLAQLPGQWTCVQLNAAQLAQPPRQRTYVQLSAAQLSHQPCQPTCVQLNLLATSSSPSAYILGYLTPLRGRRGSQGVRTGAWQAG